MSEFAWYYVDRAQQRHGPVTAADVAAAYASGEVSDASLVWREGLPEWVPLSGFHDELGLGATPVVAVATPAPAPIPSSPAAGTVTPPAKSRSGCLIVGIVLGLVFLVFVGIIAAIALPAYREYVELAEKAASGTSPDGSGTDTAIPDTDSPTFGTSADPTLLAAALAEARTHQGLVEDFVANTDRCPRDSSEVAIPSATSAGVVSITVGEADTGMCTITVELGGPGLESLAGEQLTLSRDIAGDWYCTSGITDRDSLPEECR